MNVFLIVLSGLIFLVLLARALFFLVDVDGYSMVPALENGDRVLILRLWHTGWLRRGQIMVTRYVATPWNPLRYPMAASRDRYIKRIIGMEGDVVVTQLSDLPEPIQEKHQSQHDEEGQRLWQVPPGHCFVKGDSFGLDSTLIGPIPLHAVRGIVLVKLRSGRRTPRRESTPEIKWTPAGFKKASGASINLTDHRHTEKP